jgi:hypothetical protein
VSIINDLSRRLAVLAMVLVWLIQPAAAIGYCSRPTAPSCPMMGKFDSDWEFNSCKSEMQSYQDDVERYGRCLAEEQAAVIREFNEAVERFNCYARGSSFC